MSGGFGSFGWMGQYLVALLRATSDIIYPSDVTGLLLWQSAEDATTFDATASTNLSTWTNSGLSSVTSGIADPFSGTSAWTLTETNTAAIHSLSAAFSATRQGGEVEIDVYVKRSSGTRNFSVGISTSHWATINLDTGVVTTGGTLVPFQYVSSTNVGNGWWRLRCVLSNTTTPAVVYYINNTASGAPASYTGDGSSAITVYSTYYARQRKVSGLTIKSGSLVQSSSQNTDALRPMLFDDPTLNYNTVIGCFHASVGKLLVDDPSIATSLSGTDKPFTYMWVGRHGQTTNNSNFKLAGTTASHVVLGSSASYVFGMSRTDDAGATVSASFGATDFTLDNNWHVYSVIYSGTSSLLYIDGQRSSSSFAMDVGVASFTTHSSSFLSNHWKERAIYNRTLTDNERSSVEVGMASRAGLPTFSTEYPLNIPGVQAWFASDPSMITLATSSVPATAGNWTAITQLSRSLNGDGSYRTRDTIDAGSGGHYISTTVTGAIAGTALIRTEVKRASTGSTGWFGMFANAAGDTAYFDLVSGTLGTQTRMTASITPLETGSDGFRWYRCEAYYTYASTALRFYAASGSSSTAYQGSGNDQYDVRNIEHLQYRVSSLMEKGPSERSLTQATAGSQPYLSSGSYIFDASLSGTYNAFGDNTGTAKSIGANAINTIWNGLRTPHTFIVLGTKTQQTPGALNDWLRITGTTAQRSLRLNAAGQLDYFIKDDAGTTVQGAYQSASLPNGPITVSETYDGTTLTAFVTGTQIATVSPGTLATSSFASNFQLFETRTTTREIVVANRVLSSTERASIELGMKRRAGLI